MIKKSVVITGASGHIGFHVALQLLELGHHVTLLIRTENQNIVQLKNLGAKVMVANLQKPESYQHQFEGIDVLFHIASENTTATKNEEKIVQNTFGLTRTVIDTALHKNVKTIIYTSSVVVLGRSKDPNVLIDETSTNYRTQISNSHNKLSTGNKQFDPGKNHKINDFESPYVKGKFLAEEYCDQLIREKQVDIRRIYPSWVLGSNNLKVTPPQKIIKDYLQKGQWFYFNGGISVACVNSVAKAHINAWLKGKPNEKYITAGNNVSFKNFYNALAKRTGYIKPFIFVPKWIIYLAALTGKIFFKNRIAINPEYVQAVIGNYSWYSSQKAIKQLGYTIPKLDMILYDALVEIKENNKIT